MAIGSFGNIVFEVSSDKKRTFDELNRSGSARIALHNRQGLKELPEFLGPGAETISFSMRISAYDGINPKEELETLRAYRDTGTAVLFVLNGEPVGDGYWLIESISEEHPVIDNKGRTVVATCSVTIREYTPTRE